MNPSFDTAQHDSNYWYTLARVAFACSQSAWDRGDIELWRKSLKFHHKYTEKFRKAQRNESRKKRLYD